MKKQPNIKLNFLYNISYQILLVITPLLVAPYISRVLGDDNIGTYSYTYSMAHYFAVFCMLGVSHHGNRTIAVCRDDQDRLNQTFSEITTLKFLISAIVLSAYAIYVGLIADESYRLYSVLQVFYILSFVLDIHWFFAGLEEFKVTVMRLLIIKVLSMICIFSFVKTADDLWIYTLIMSGSFLISEVYLWIVARKRVKWKLPRLKDALKHLKPILVLFIPILAVDLYRMMDKIMLGEIISMGSVGQYENADKIIKICLGVVTALSSVMLPRMAKLNAENDTGTMRRYMGNSMRVILAMSCALVAGILAVGKTFAPTFFGPEFVECGSVLQVLSFSVLFVAFSNLVRTQYLIPCHKDRIYILAVWGGVALNLVLNILLIPWLGAIGAAIATAVTELLVSIIQAICVWKSLPMGVFFKNLLAYGVIGAVMFVAVKAVGWIPIPGELGWLPIPNAGTILILVLQVVIGAIVYLSLVAIYLWITDRELIRSAGKSAKRILKKLHLVH